MPNNQECLARRGSGDRNRDGERGGVSRLLAFALLLLALPGCGGPVDAEDVNASGVWSIFFGASPSEFQLELVEADDGSVTGFWSFPDQFAYHQVWGRRDGTEVALEADSPNLFPVTFDMHFVDEDRMNGYFYFAGTTEPISLRRGSNWE